MGTYEKVVSIAKEKKIPITVLEAKSGISRSGISKWKDHSPTLENLQKVATALDISIQELLSYGEGGPNGNV